MRLLERILSTGVIFILLTFVVAHGEQSPREGWLGLGFTWREDGEKAILHVEGVIPNGPAAKAGVKPFDLIVGINGTAIPFTQETELLEFLAGLKPGQSVRFAVARGTSRPQTFTVVVGEMPREYQEAKERSRKQAKEKAKRSRQ